MKSKSKTSEGKMMKPHDLFGSIPRRTFMAGVGTTAAGMFLRPMFASAAGASPMRLVVIHRPCGTDPAQFFPTGGDATTFTLPLVLQPLEAVKGDMVILNGINCPRDQSWPGDQHGAGLISMMSGRRPIEIPGTNSGGDPNAKNQCAPGPSFDQFLLQKAPQFQGTIVPSIQSTAYRPSSIGLPNFKVMSYTGVNGTLFPESRPSALFSNMFAAAMPNASPEVLERMRLQNKGVLDFVNKDLTRLRGLVPKSQLGKLDAHLGGIQQLEARLVPRPGGGPADPACKPPAQTNMPDPTADLTVDEAQHKIAAQNQLALITAAFQCDLTRIAAFTFAHGNSALRFQKIIPGFTDGGGHHDVSHITGATNLHAAIDRFYSGLLAEFVAGLKATP
ncbi:MAG TPA: DUF1552 domain-containing protein, partial [Polyangia bacterium]|nr:DUF1552 domain-containing protein [Polyangia bacterium]